jgi:CRP/FNR family transcriptional regulator, dissimilatory nitrate respiration regulator
MKPKVQVTEKQETGYRRQSLSCLRGASLFSDLSDEDLVCFQDAAQSLSYKKGKILYLQDESAKSFYIICGGWIKLFHTMPEGEEVIIDMLTAGHMVGEGAIFEHGRHTSSAQVVEDVQLLSIPAHILKEQIHLNPALALSMLSSMSRHHRRHYSAIALNAMQSAPQRIGCFLLRLCPPDNKKGAAFHLPYDKTLIAETLGMKSATFSRALNILRQKANIRINGTCVEIDSVAQLTKFVYGPLAAKYAPEEL